MKIISDYYLIFLLWFFCLLLITLTFYLYNKTESIYDTKRDKKDIAFFQIAIVSVLLIASFDSSIYIKKHIDDNLLNDSINSYLNEGFIVIDDEKVCNIPNSVIYLNDKGKETTENDYVVKLCI
jgi:hypothetical protein